ncbi:7-carboxy-7-deazaguanine synthase QueE [Rhodospirillum sp. A1_3_36]|uniref:7-carboxy-7-deazaguanine synthase QueE n=1 Tax=Rhodospirillum sp. A1_3_36 TaxID=3391666 RepID=UPI0039A4906B
MTEGILRVSEIFGPTIQGEGPLIGHPTVFVRLGGCDYRCSWCDTLHAVDPKFRATWMPMDAATVWAKVTRLSGGDPVMISLSGGNPAIQPLGGVIARGKAEGYRFALETQGSIDRAWFADLDHLILSPKPPSSGMVTDWGKLADCLQAAGDGPQVSLKVVVMDEADYTFAKGVASRFPTLPLTLQPGNHTPPSPDTEDGAIDLDGIGERLRWLAERVTADRWFSARVLPQLHVMIWGNRRGV